MRLDPVGLIPLIMHHRCDRHQVEKKQEQAGAEQCQDHTILPSNQLPNCA